MPGAPLEHAKLLWAMAKPHRAIIEMQQVLHSRQWTRDMCADVLYKLSKYRT